MGKFANWELAKEIRVGDYGTVDSKTGTFEKDGNIYDENLIPNKTDKDDIVPGEPLSYWKVSTETAHECNFSGGPEVNVAGIADVALAGTWKFDEKRGAVLLMHLPQLWQIPNMKLLDRLVDVPEVKGKYIVSDAYACPASSLYISGKSSEEVTITLHAEVDPIVAGVAAAVPVGGGGNVKGGCKGRYTPLFTLKKRRWYAKWRGVPQAPIDPNEDKYEDIDVPWGPLDSDGEDALDPGGEDEEYSDIEKMPEDLVRRSPRTAIVG
ncbi:hypothetical protein HWV62_3208 [Athelia sp. TMB]|nr:hypothetical protein HWV62_3208 [Athelia sp. TMB]